MSSEELCILASWFLSQMSRNSVSEESRVRILAVIQEQRIKGKKCLSQRSVGGKRRRAECHLRKGGTVVVIKGRDQSTERGSVHDEE